MKKYFENSEQIIQLFKDKILAVRNYKSEKKEFTVEDFTDLDFLKQAIDEINTGESDITPAGKSFLEALYGFTWLGDYLARQKFKITNRESFPDEISTWLECLEPMETITFIEKSKGSNTNNESLKDKLRPPEELKNYSKLSNCPICGFGYFGPFNSIEELKHSYAICPCCGTEFGLNDDEERKDWYLKEFKDWFNPKMKPDYWNKEEQLKNAFPEWPPV